MLLCKTIRMLSLFLGGWKDTGISGYGNLIRSHRQGHIKISSSRSSSPEKYKDHNFGHSSRSLTKLSLNNNVSHRLVRTDFLREVVYHNNLIVVSDQKYLENVILTKNLILRCQKMFCLRMVQTLQLKQEEKRKKKLSKTAVS